MRDKFEFVTDDQSAEYCKDIIEKMVSLFGIGTEEAIGRMNDYWRRASFLGPDDLIYHEDTDYWAYTLYYGSGSMWWLNPPELKPLPYPKNRRKE